ncbi:MAG TPA: hypothetical protein VFI18_05905 [Gaiellales bacterium]|nr:hypothetical protein [Gaiellales bacterium]
MRNALARALKGLTVVDVERIRTGCGHVRVPSAPAARGYRYVDLVGEEPPFYVRRLTAGRQTGSIMLHAPIETTSGDEAERGAPGIARASVSIDVNTIPWSGLLDVELCSGPWATLLGDALEELAALEILEPTGCPLCTA